MQAFIISVIFNTERPSKLAFQLQRKHECGKFIFRLHIFLSEYLKYIIPMYFQGN